MNLQSSVLIDINQDTIKNQKYKVQIDIYSKKYKINKNK